MRRLILIAAALIASTAAQAHVGVGDANGFVHGFGHPLSGIDHILAMVAVGLFAAHLGGRALYLVPLSFVGMMIVGGALGMAGVHLPYVEVGIGFSVVVLGAAVAFGLNVPTAIAMALVGFFAIFHGHSHGTEMPETASGLEYGAGFILATAALHAIGIGVGLAIGMASEACGKRILQTVGGAMAVAEVCRNLACTGAEPIGLTDCLNFGNPERPEVMEQFARSIDGIAAACTALGVPIVSGNVSLYNDTDGRSVLPTPTIAGVGLVAAREDIVTSPFKRAGDAVWLLGVPSCSGQRALGGSEWLVRRSGGRVVGFGPTIDLVVESNLQKVVLELARARVLSSAHDVSDGGLATTLAECAAAGPEDVGATVTLPVSASAVDALALLFGEAPSLVVLSAPEASSAAIEAAAKSHGVRAVRLGATGGVSLCIEAAPLPAFRVAVADLRARRDACLEPIVGA